MSPENPMPLRIDVHIHTHPFLILWLVFIGSMALGFLLGSR